MTPPRPSASGCLHTLAGRGYMAPKADVPWAHYPPSKPLLTRATSRGILTTRRRRVGSTIGERPKSLRDGPATEGILGVGSPPNASTDPRGPGLGDGGVDVGAYARRRAGALPAGGVAGSGPGG